MNKNECRLERVSNVTVGFVLMFVGLLFVVNRNNGLARDRPPDCRTRIGPCRDIFGITPQQGLFDYCPKNTRRDKQLSKLRRDELQSWNSPPVDFTAVKGLFILTPGGLLNGPSSPTPMPIMPGWAAGRICVQRTVSGYYRQDSAVRPTSKPLNMVR